MTRFEKLMCMVEDAHTRAVTTEYAGDHQNAMAWQWYANEIKEIIFNKPLKDLVYNVE